NVFGGDDFFRVASAAVVPAIAFQILRADVTGFSVDFDLRPSVGFTEDVHFCSVREFSDDGCVCRRLASQIQIGTGVDGNVFGGDDFFRAASAAVVPVIAFQLLRADGTGFSVDFDFGPSVGFTEDVHFCSVREFSDDGCVRRRGASQIQIGTGVDGNVFGG